MQKWIECVPNFSEGRRPEVVQKIIETIVSVPGIYLLGQEMDKDHNRAVITFVGSPFAVGEAAFRSIAKAKELIDLNQHKGEHPRMGATDVCPFIPLQGATMEDCIKLSNELGKRVGDELEIPVYLYESAATRPDRKNLANIREGQFEKLREWIGKDPNRVPDYGPNRIHPTAGAMAIGARFFLIAYNVNLKSTDVKLAKKIAKSVREKDGGFPCIKSLGFALDERKMIQVSMNLTDYRKTSMKTVFDEISKQAMESGVEVAESEIVGLLPLDALENHAKEVLKTSFEPGQILEGIAKNTLKLSNFQTEQIIEKRIEQAMQDPLVSMEPFLEATASSTPTPGGGSVSALAGALAAALGRMVIGITANSKKYKEQAQSLAESQKKLEQLQIHLAHLVKEDSQAYESYVIARKMKNETEAEQKARRQALDDASMRAILVPLDTMRKSLEVLQILPEIAYKGTPNAISDIGVAANMAFAAVEGGMFNIIINLKTLKDQVVAAQIDKDTKEILAKSREMKEQILKKVEEIIHTA